MKKGSLSRNASFTGNGFSVGTLSKKASGRFRRRQIIRNRRKSCLRKGRVRGYTEWGKFPEKLKSERGGGRREREKGWKRPWGGEERQT